MDRDQVIQALNNELAELDELIKRVHRDSQEYRDGAGSSVGQLSQHPAEYGSDVATVMEQSLSLDAARSRREQVLAAKQRLDEGSYGICVDCGRPIGEERLEALPWAARCIQDQEKANR
ncbi:MAG: TraR/DksA family transcriptional regulator [Pseudonocardiaceae bacterium]